MGPVALVGTTASGKSTIAMAAAKVLGDVAICQVDSMCVYRGMDLATAKPTRKDRDQVRHFLVDLVDPDEEFSVTEFQRAAFSALDACADLRLQPLLVGGTGLYHRAVIDALEIPGQFPEVQASLRGRLDEVGLAALYGELAVADPLGASRIDPANERRILRALEVTIGSGRPFSSFGPGLRSYGEHGMVQIGIPFDPATVDAAIDARIASWRSGGLLEEVSALISGERPMSKTAAQALGYKELISYLHDECTLDEAYALIAQRTRKLARRQWSWFRRDPRVRWIAAGEDPTTVLVDALKGERRGVSVTD